MVPGDQARQSCSGAARSLETALVQSEDTTTVEGSYVLACRLTAGRFESCVIQARRSGFEMIGDPVACSIGGHPADLRRQLEAAVVKVMLMEEADGLAGGWISAVSLIASGTDGEVLRELLAKAHPDTPLLERAEGATATAIGAAHPVPRSTSAPAPSSAEPPSWEVNHVHAALSPSSPPALAEPAHHPVLAGVAAATVLGLAAAGMLPGVVDDQPLGHHDRALPDPPAGWVVDPPASDRGSGSGAMVALDSLLAFGDVEGDWNQAIADTTADLHETCGGGWALARVALTRSFATQMGAAQLTNEVRSFESPLIAQTSLDDVEGNVAGCDHVTPTGNERRSSVSIVQLPASRHPLLGDASFVVAATTSGREPTVTLFGLVRNGRFLTSIDLSLPASLTSGADQPLVGDDDLRRFDELMILAARRLERAVEPAD